MNASFKFSHQYASIFDAEIVALATAVKLDLVLRSNTVTEHRERQSTIYCDNLGTVQIANQILRNSRYHPGISASSRNNLKMLADFLVEHQSEYQGDLSISHVKAHTGGTSMEQRLNEKADKRAKTAAESGPIWKEVQGYTDTYILHNKDEGFTHAATRHTLEWFYNKGDSPTLFRLARKREQQEEDTARESMLMNQPGWGPQLVFHDRKRKHATRIEDVYYFNQWDFTGSRGGYAAQVQLLIRSHQLPTPKRNRGRNTQDSEEIRAERNHCYLCNAPLALVDETHLFVDCPGTEQLKASILSELRRKILVSRDEDSEERIRNLDTLLETLLTDGPTWSTGKTYYWQGLLPKHHDYDARLGRYYADIGSAAIKLTSAIWWKWLKERRTLANRHR